MAEINNFDLPRFLKSAWGMVVANASNDPTGRDNLLVIADPSAGVVRVIDFEHASPPDFGPPAILEKLSGIFRMDLPHVLLPARSNARLALWKEEAGDAEFPQPRGVCTDRVGNFWVVDRANGSVERFQYNPELRRLAYIGHLSGFVHPIDVAYLRCDGGTLG
ncbi:MAG: hypothetical protein GF331_05350, partial [Chitinivibrionales bacterium]|nr:hypothetical protein [Chitinivibrionales bacterium]